MKLRRVKRGLAVMIAVMMFFETSYGTGIHSKSLVSGTENVYASENGIKSGEENTIAVYEMPETGTEINIGQKISDQTEGGKAGRKYYTVSIPSSGVYLIHIKGLTGEGKGIYYAGFSEMDFTYNYYKYISWNPGKIIFSVESKENQLFAYEIEVDTVQNISIPVSNEEIMGDAGYYKFIPEKDGLYEVVNAGCGSGIKTSQLYDDEFVNLCEFYNNSTKYYLQKGTAYYLECKRQENILRLCEEKSYPDGTRAGVEEGIMWNLNKEGLLIFEGEGEIPCHSRGATPPWRAGKTIVNNTIEKVIIGEGITGIGDDSFYCCFNLKEVQMPDSIERIGIESFRECRSLDNVHLPSGLIEIQLAAFLYCGNLSSIVIPPYLKEIGASAFGGCTALHDISFSGENNLNYIGNYAFQGTSWAKQQGDFVILDDTLLDYTGTGEEIVIPDSVKEIGVHSLSDSDSVKKIIFHDQICKIWEYGISDCKNLKEVHIPGSVSDIVYNAFSGCTALEKAVLEEGVASVGERAFLNNDNLKIAKLPNSMTTIGEYALGYCSSAESNFKIVKSKILPKIRCQENSAAYQYALENGLPYTFFDDEIEDNINQTDQNQTGGSSGGQDNKEEGGPGNKADSSLRKTVNGSQYQILTNKQAAFAGIKNQKAKKVKIPSTVKIDHKTYKVTAIAERAFANRNISNVIIGANVQSIGDKAFYNCKKLEKIIIPSKVNKIGSHAFENCKKLKSITVKTAKLTQKRMGKNAFKGIYAKAKIKVPKNKLKVYQKWFKTKGAGKKVEFVK